jgi:hypothetical protein
MSIHVDVVDQAKVERNRDGLFEGIHWNILETDWRDSATVMHGRFDAAYVKDAPVWADSRPLMLNFGKLWDLQEINLAVPCPIGGVITLGNVLTNVRDFLYSYYVPWSTVEAHKDTFSAPWFEMLKDAYSETGAVPLAHIDERTVLTSIKYREYCLYDVMFSV